MFPYQDINEVYELSADELSKYSDWSTDELNHLVYFLYCMKFRHVALLKPKLMDFFSSGGQADFNEDLQGVVREHVAGLNLFTCGIETSYGLLAEFQDYFTNLGEAYDLLDEFKENALC